MMEKRKNKGKIWYKKELYNNNRQSLHLFKPGNSLRFKGLTHIDKVCFLCFACCITGQMFEF